MITKFGEGKAKDRIRDALLRNWQACDPNQQQLVTRLHAAAAVKMLFDLPAEVFVDEDELRVLGELAASPPQEFASLPKPLLTLNPPVDRLLQTRVVGRSTIANPNWLDAVKYAVRVRLLEK